MSNQPRIITPRVIFQMLVFIVVVPSLPLLISWRWDWWEAWAYALICILGFAISRALAARRHPDLLAERGRFLQHEDAAPWDKLLAPLVGLGGGLIPLVAGLEARFGGAPAVSLPMKALALIVILAGYALPNRARPSRRIERPLPLGAASRLRRSAADLSGNTTLPGFTLGVPAHAVYRGHPGCPHRPGGSDLAG